MNISNLLSFHGLSPWSKPAAAEKKVGELSPLALAVQRADQKIQAEVQVNTAQVSAFGQLKSAVSELQIAAKELEDLASTATAASFNPIENALTRVVSAFNTASATTLAGAALPGDVAASQSARRMGKALLNAFSDPDTSKALSGIGITVQQGNLALESGQLASAIESAWPKVRAALIELGQGLNNTATQELESRGNVGDVFQHLIQHARLLEAQQSAINSAAQATSADTSAHGPQGRRGVTAYRASATPS